jgi:hypothetical protein
MQRSDIAKAFDEIHGLIKAELIRWTKFPFKDDHGADIPNAMGYHGEVTDWSFTVARFSIPGTSEPRFDGAVSNARKGLVMHLPHDLSQELAEQAEAKATTKAPKERPS